MEAEIRNLRDVIDILKRRKWSFILPGSVICVVAVFLAFTLPPVFRSTSTILIEEQEVPQEFVQTTVTSYAEERLQTINQRIMSSTRLLEVMNRFELYAELKDQLTTEELIGKMRQAIRFETISADVVDRRTGRASTATIAFSLSYEGKDPRTVQQVANMLTSLYLEENYKVREQQALGTSRFLEEEMNALQAQLSEIDGKISLFKQKHIDSLPELYQVNLQGIDRVERDLDQLSNQLRSLKEREEYLQTQLAATPASLNQARLQELRLQLSQLKSRFSDEYPDVVKVRTEIANLERYMAPGQVGGDPEPDNPAYVTLAAQLASIRSEIASVGRQVEIFTGKRDEFRRRIEATPNVEENYKGLMVRRGNLQAKYDDLMKKYMEAKVAHGLEKDKMAERFTLIEAPRVPERPVSPNRKAIVLIGIVLGLGAGVGMAALRENLDSSVRRSDLLSKATGLPVLVGIPELVTEQDLARRRKFWRAATIGAVILAAGGMIAFHFLVIDLEVLWAQVAQKAAFYM